MMKKKLWLSSVLLLVSGLVHANEPLPLKVLVGFGAGGSADLAARLLAERLKDELGRPVVLKKTKSPGARDLRETGEPTKACSSVVRGNRSRNASSTTCAMSPEQSSPSLGREPPSR
jgi:hypothetical protein